MFALMVLYENLLNMLHHLPHRLAGNASSRGRHISLDNGFGPLNESFLFPMRTLAVLPLYTTQVAEFRVAEASLNVASLG